MNTSFQTMNTSTFIIGAATLALTTFAAALLFNVLAAPAMLAGAILMPVGLLTHDYAPRRRGYRSAVTAAPKHRLPLAA
jgi:hypothetical protein